MYTDIEAGNRPCSSKLWALALLAVMLMSTCSLVMSCITLNRHVAQRVLSNILPEDVLVHPTTVNPGGRPTAKLYVGDMLWNVATTFDSTDSSGLVRAAQVLPNTPFIITVTFGKPFANMPKSVVVTASSQALLAAPLSVSLIDSSSFQVIGFTTPSNAAGNTEDLFYYQVL